MCIIEWIDGYHVTDVAARVLAEERPSKQRSPILRLSAVEALRFVWRKGGVDNRATVAARVHVWLGHDQERVKATSSRVEAREIARQQAQGGVR